MKFLVVLFFTVLLMAEAVMVTRPSLPSRTTESSLNVKSIKLSNRAECLNMCANLGKPPARSACKQVCSLEFPVIWNKPAVTPRG
ncbi:hypothetical protein PRIPAC_85193 [Pristionchus pacificus]|uniref:Uncharacterized protein n=1 Tax=Pristionchus pacificus TaxID=54126 RepID=A0A454Y299_PRIPA|nr:hypothetical protein PRIPAC_85193 [Pristionchus pacificus]|eukprot:PDM69772.1 hypothetical protein PRIPAC_44868 [Pristionchus pacificus]